MSAYGALCVWTSGFAIRHTLLQMCAATNEDQQPVMRAIREAVRESVAEIFTNGYLDAVGAADYLGVSRRGFEAISREIPCHRLNPRGKRFFKREDLDGFMGRHRVLPVDQKQLNDLVDGVVCQVRAK